jgi:glycosidase
VNAALVALFTLDGVPFLYNGQEVADAARHSIFGKLPIDWAAGETATGQARFAFCQKLCALRKAEKALTQGELAWLDNDQPDAVLSFMRTLGGTQIVSVVNLTGQSVNVKVRGADGAAFAQVLGDGVTGDAQSGVAAGPHGYWIGKR